MTSPPQVGAANTEGVFSSARLVCRTRPRRRARSSSPTTSPNTAATAQTIDPTSAEAYSAGMLLQQVAKKTGKIDNATIIKTLHSGTWPTLVGDLELGPERSAARRIPADPVDQRQAHHRLSRRSVRSTRRSRPSPTGPARRIESHARTDPGDHPRCPDRRRLRPHGQRSDTDLRDHEGGQSRAGRPASCSAPT